MSTQEKPIKLALRFLIGLILMVNVYGLVHLATRFFITAPVCPTTIVLGGPTGYLCSANQSLFYRTSLFHLVSLMFLPYVVGGLYFRVTWPGVSRRLVLIAASGVVLAEKAALLVATQVFGETAGKFVPALMSSSLVWLYVILGSLISVLVMEVVSKPT